MKKIELETRVFELITLLGDDKPLARNTRKYLKYMKAHSRDTYLHECRVALLAKRLAEHCGFSSVKPEFFGGLNHDVGKLNIEKKLLDKDEITEPEYEKIKNHAYVGAKGLSEHLVTAYIAGSHHKYQKESYGIDLKDINFPKVSTETKERIENAVINVALADFFDAACTRNIDIRNCISEGNSKKGMEETFPDYKERVDFLFNDREALLILENNENS